MAALGAPFVPFTAQTRMSGVNLDGRQIRKGAADAIEAHVREARREPSRRRCARQVERIARDGGTPLVVSDGARVLGRIHLKDIVKGGIKERFAELRRMGIKTIMITGDNPLTAAAIAAEAGVDDFLAEATPEAKLALIRDYQAKGHLVAMTGDGTNDAPALAQADVAVAMNTGTQAAKEAGNMVDLDSNPTKLLEVVHIGKQLLMTRGALTTFSIANDVAKYFAIIPAAFAATYPGLAALNVMHLATPQSAMLSAVIFNALIIVALIPLALKGVKYRPVPASQLSAPQPARLRPGRARPALPRHQAHRHGPRRPCTWREVLMEKQALSAFLCVLVLTVLTGLAYPLVVTGLAQAPLPAQATGSLVVQDGRVVGSALIGQPFVGPEATSGAAPRPRRPIPTTPPSPRAPTWAPPTPTWLRR